MLIRFSVQNYLSFSSQQTFSMAAGKYTRHKDQVVTIDGKRILKGGIIFGANASGKSNLIRALRFGKRVAINGIDATVLENKHFRISADSYSQPGVFQYDFFVSGHFYSYGFAISYEKCGFLSEWLYICDNGKEIKIFERGVEEHIHTDLVFSGDNLQRFNIYADDVQNNVSFLHEIVRHKLQDDKEFEHFYNVLEWFNSLIIVFPQTKYYNYGGESIVLNDSTVAKYLRYFDTGIEEIKKIKKPIDEVLAFIPGNTRAGVISDVQKGLRPASKEKGADSVEVNFFGKRFSFSIENDQIVADQLLMNHGNELDLFDIEDESDGTRRLFDLIPLLHKGCKSYVIIVDELDRSFHSKLTYEYIQKFFEKTEGCHSQLIATVHDLSVMDLELLRQDEIWFIERDENHSSKLYSLNRFKERFDRSVAKDYMLGRYGSIPNFMEDELDEDY